MKRTGTILMLGAVLMLATWATADAQTVWKLQSLLNPGYMGTDAEIWFSKEVERRTGGKLKITVYPGGALGFGGARILTAVGGGLLEASQMWGAHVSGDLRLSEIIELPGLIPYDIPLRKKIVQMVLPHQEKAMARVGVFPFASGQVEPRNIYSRNPIRSLADLKGVKLRAQGVVETEFTKAIGATPVTLSWEEVYPAMQQGVIDAYWVTHSATYNAKLYEVAKYCYEVGIGGANWYIVLSKEALDALSPDVRKVVLDLRQPVAEKLWDRVDPDIREFRKRLVDKGMTFAQASPEDMETMLKVAPKVWDIWLQKAGPDAKQLVERIKAIVAEWEKKGRKL
ncbi:MAG: TRAP transporter substrate-binding protein [Candidatus Methylomirabilia bacterium]